MEAEQRLLRMAPRSQQCHVCCDERSRSLHTPLSAEIAVVTPTVLRGKNPANVDEPNTAT